jgi:hypothetical protein
LLMNTFLRSVRCFLSDQAAIPAFPRADAAFTRRHPPKKRYSNPVFRCDMMPWHTACRHDARVRRCGRAESDDARMERRELS